MLSLGVLQKALASVAAEETDAGEWIASVVKLCITLNPKP